MANAVVTTGSTATIAVTSDDANLDLTLTPKGSGDVATAADLDAAGGYRQAHDLWFQDDVAASQTGVALARIGDAVWASMDGKLIMHRAGSVTAVAVKSNAARDAGTCTVEVTKNGVGIGLTAVLDGTNTTFNATAQAKDTDAFVAGDEIGAIITTDGAWKAPTGANSADIRVVIEVEL